MATQTGELLMRLSGCYEFPTVFSEETILNDDQAREAVTWAYRLLLGREPESNEIIEKQVNRLSTGSVQEIRRRFMNSEEFKAKMPSGLRAPLVADPRAEAVERFNQRFRDPVTYEGLAGYFIDSFGVRTRLAYLPQQYKSFSGQVASEAGVAQLPLHDNVELLGFFEALDKATAMFVVAELGAGWGPWMALGAKIARKRGLTFSCLGVEAFDRTYGFLQSNLMDNGINPKDHKVIRAAVGPKDGNAVISTKTHSLTVLEAGSDPSEYGSPEYEKVPCHSIATILKGTPTVDFLHCDIQGAEADAIAASISVINRTVKRIVIGTHSREAEDRLFSTLSSADWTLVDEFSCRYKQNGRAMRLVADGSQYWKNNRLT